MIATAPTLLLAAALLAPAPTTATSLTGAQVSVTKSASAVTVHSPAESTIQDISTNPQLTFRPVGDIKTIVAFARLQASVDIGEILAACDHARTNMDSIWNLAPKGTDAHEYASTHPLIVQAFQDTRLELRNACHNLKNWDSPDNFFTERSYPHKRHETQGDPSQEHLAAAYQFGTADPEFRGSPNSTTTDDNNRVARAEPWTIASVIIGGAMLLVSLYNLLFGGSTPTWSMTTATEKIGSGAWASAKALSQLCEKIQHVWHFDEFMNYVNGARDNAKDLIGLVNDIRRGIFQLLIGNISPVFLTSINIQGGIDALAQEASVHNLQLAVRSAADVLLMPAFGIRINRTLRIVVPIPVASDTLAAHEFAGTPLLAGSESEGFSLITPQPTHSCIAVDGSSSNHILFNKGDLDGCFQAYKTFMCPEFPVRTNRQASCLGSLFTANTADVHTHCRFAPFKETWHMSRAGRGQFVLASATSTSATTSCPQGHSKSVAMKPGIYRLAVPPGCTTMTPHVSVTAAYTDFAQVDVHKTLEWSPARYAAYQRNYSALEEIQRHATHAAADIHQGVTMLHDLHRTPWWHHAAWGLALIAAIAAIVLFVVCRFRGVSSTIAALTAATRITPTHAAAPETIVKYRAPQPPLSPHPAITFQPDHTTHHALAAPPKLSTVP